MTPLSFDLTTSRAMVGDERARIIEAKARADADAEVCDPPAVTQGSYWHQRQSDFEYILYLETHHRRLARNERKKNPREHQAVQTDAG